MSMLADTHAASGDPGAPRRPYDYREADLEFEVSPATDVVPDVPDPAFLDRARRAIGAWPKRVAKLLAARDRMDDAEGDTTDAGRDRYRVLYGRWEDKLVGMQEAEKVLAQAIYEMLPGPPLPHDFHPYFGRTVNHFAAISGDRLYFLRTDGNDQGGTFSLDWLDIRRVVDVDRGRYIDLAAVLSGEGPGDPED